MRSLMGAIPFDNGKLKFCGLLWVKLGHSRKVHVKIIRKGKTACGQTTFYQGVSNKEPALVNPENQSEICSTCWEFMKKRFT